MEEQRQYSSLPVEILNEIFKGLTANKKELSPCLLVCRSWYLVAQEFFSKGIHITMNDMKLNSLYQDIQKYPEIATKISHLKLDRSSTGSENPETLRSVINLCSNLTELQFDILDVYHYLSSLNCPAAKLPNIQKIKILNMHLSSPAVRRFHLWVNYRFRTTITSLEIADLEDNGALNNYGGLIKMLSHYPKLIDLKAKSLTELGASVDLDLTSLLETCPALQEIKLYNIGEIFIKSSVVNEPTNATTIYRDITKIKLCLRRIDIQTLNFLTTRFPNVNNLRVIAPVVTSDITLTTTESQKILDDFRDHANSLKRANIHCSYKNETFINIDIGNTRQKLWGPNFMFFAEIPDEFLQELLLMNEEWMERDEDFFYDDHHDDGFLDYEDDFLQEREDMLYEQHIAEMLHQQHLEEEEYYEHYFNDMENGYDSHDDHDNHYDQDEADRIIQDQYEEEIMAHINPEDDAEELRQMYYNPSDDEDEKLEWIMRQQHEQHCRKEEKERRMELAQNEDDGQIDNNDEEEIRQMHFDPADEDEKFDWIVQQQYERNCLVEGEERLANEEYEDHFKSEDQQYDSDY